MYLTDVQWLEKKKPRQYYKSAQVGTQDFILRRSYSDAKV